MTSQRMLVLLAVAAAAALAGCGSRVPLSSSPAPGQARDAGDAYASPSSPAASQRSYSNASSYEAYKRDLAMQISETNSARVFAGRPQALLRSVIVVKYVVDRHGNLVRSEILRSNRDSETESTALAALRKSAPFPKPATHLLKNGRIEISETWLFNNDGRFQLRTIAQPQADS
ncbi:energy transducer TonB family protein [Noviherbaspirillum galbum]|uniref:TonB family protein n=1 Tax=Noviherbaspirillum galbum TaxID=2709383 RepID=A0A6B3SWG1_9BURK|nr:TonB family protein [Noviherbaspirillum galbum]NEX63296.1 TonB family protein [Noviherbaspirillum galbum]